MARRSADAKFILHDKLPDQKYIRVNFSEMRAPQHKWYCGMCSVVNFLQFVFLDVTMQTLGSSTERHEPLPLLRAWKVIFTHQQGNFLCKHLVPFYLLNGRRRNVVRTGTVPQQISRKSRFAKPSDSTGSFREKMGPPVTSHHCERQGTKTQTERPTDCLKSAAQ